MKTLLAVLCLLVMIGPLSAKDSKSKSPNVSKITISPAFVSDDTPCIGVVYLHEAAAQGGVSVSLAVDGESYGAKVPDSVMIPEGATSAAFTIAIPDTGNTEEITVQASIAGSSDRPVMTVFAIDPPFTPDDVTVGSDCLLYLDNAAVITVSDSESVLKQAIDAEEGGLKTPIHDLLASGHMYTVDPNTKCHVIDRKTYKTAVGLHHKLYEVKVLEGDHNNAECWVEGVELAK